jgi:hypothetical protein
MRITDNVVGREREKIARFQVYRLGIELPDAHLGTRKVRHDGETASRGPGRGSEVLDYFLVAREIPMGKVEPGYVHAGQQQFFHHSTRI